MYLQLYGNFERDAAYSEWGVLFLLQRDLDRETSVLFRVGLGWAAYDDDFV